MNNATETLCAHTIRTLSMDAVQKANSGHPGMPMGMADVATVLWTKFLKHNPKNPEWFDRDRFILSAGHGSMLLYSLLHLSGYDLSMEDRVYHTLSLTSGEIRTNNSKLILSNNTMNRAIVFEYESKNGK